MHTNLYFLFVRVLSLVFLSFCFSSCGLFDKELKQDERMADFRRQMARVEDSLDSHKDRIKAYNTIIEYINTDKDLITPRKKNLILVECSILMSNEYFDVKNYKKAIDVINNVIQIDSLSSKGYYSRGCIYQTTGNDSLALNDYGMAIQLNGNCADAYYNRGIIYEEDGNWDQALRDYSKAIKLQPPYVADVYNNRGNTYLAKQMADKAIEDYDKAISIDTVNITAYSNRAGAYIVQKDMDKALYDCNKVISLDSTNVHSYNRRASVYYANSQYEEALNDYQKIIQLDPYNKQGMNAEVKEAIRDVKALMKKK
ncbi:MAG: tetratricopeptide repeat protein [Dysgonomonas sp.]|nr:tetratricopeptide repeat protein [Dysgonomonas sp.]